MSLDITSRTQTQKREIRERGNNISMTFDQAETVIKLLRFIRGCLVAIIVSKGLLQIIKTQVRIVEVEDEGEE